MPGDVVFTYKSNGKDVSKTLLDSAKIASREALGLWHVDTQAWKVYSKTTELPKLTDDYRRAAIDAGLPMGDPSFQQGTVRVGNENATQGFVLITKWVDGKNFQKKASAFAAALDVQRISHSVSNNDWKRIKGGCDAANQVGLKDCQGFVKAGAYEPLTFIDVHTSWNAATKRYGTSEQAQELVDVIVKWGNAK